MTWPLQPIMFHKRQNSLSRYFASEGKIFCLPRQIDKSANCLVGHGWVRLKKNKYPRSTGGYGLDVAGYGWSGSENLGPCRLYHKHMWRSYRFDGSDRASRSYYGNKRISLSFNISIYSTDIDADQSWILLFNSI